MKKTTLPSSQDTLVILLGASEWPKFPSLNTGNPDTFVNSANDLKEFFLNPHKFNLPEKNLKDLFNSNLDPNQIDLQIGAFLDECMSEMQASGCAAKNLLVYFVGHGGFTDGKDYYLAIKQTREENTISSGIAIVSLAKTLKSKARYLRCILILDCCFAAAAFEPFQAEGPAQVAITQTREALENDAPEKGNSLLCSSSSKDASKSVSHDGKHTIFSGALLHVLNNGDKWIQEEYLSLRQVNRLINRYQRATYHGTAPVAECHSPDQRKGDVAEILLFPNMARRATEHPQDVLEKFVDRQDEIQCYVIVSEAGEKRQQGESLKGIVERMLKGYKKSIEKITLPLPLHKDPFVITVSKIISSKEMYKNAILALCRSNIVIFDVTNYEPAVMLLLGIRSVVRRGVTILTTYSDFVREEHFEAPFNIKEVNLISHSEQGQYERDDPIHPLGTRILEGLDQVRHLPHYLDLPSFDAIRTLPLDADSQRPKDYTEQVLVLCSFDKGFRDNNWRRHIKRNLGVEIQDFAEMEKPPDIVRTLDLKSPRLVLQVLYEMIRLTSMCVVDWTGWRPNVFFELGVRLAANETGPVHIIEDQHKAMIQTVASGQEDIMNSDELKSFSEIDRQRLVSATSQCMQLFKLFDPIVYRASGSDADRQAYKKMVSYYQEVVKYINNKNQNKSLEKIKEIEKQWEEQWESLPPDFTYQTINEQIDLSVEIAAKPVYSELIDSANRLNAPDNSRSAVLYQNPELKKKANEGADERRLAAWYYLNYRFNGPEGIIIDSNLVETYFLLGDRLSETFYASDNDADRSLAESIRRQVRDLKKLLKEKGSGNTDQ